MSKRKRIEYLESQLALAHQARHDDLLNATRKRDERFMTALKGLAGSVVTIVTADGVTISARVTDARAETATSQFGHERGWVVTLPGPTEYTASIVLDPGSVAGQ